MRGSLGALSLRREVREAADLIIGNLNEDGYLIASDDELLGVAPPLHPKPTPQTAKNIVSEAQALGLAEIAPRPMRQVATDWDDLAAIDLAETNSRTELTSPA